MTGAGRTGAYRLVVFDWDGTLVDSTATIVDAIRTSAADLGLPVPTRAQASHVIGLGLLEAIHRAVPAIDRHQIPAFVERYRHHFLRRDASLAPFDGIPALLEALSARGHLLAVATGKSRAGLDRALAQTGWKGIFAATRCADEGAPKPDPWMLRDLCEELDVDPGETVMVGDTTHDLRMAAAFGADAVAVTYGAHPADELRALSPAACVDSVDELRAWLLAPPAAGPGNAPPGHHWRAVCASGALADGGDGVRFDVRLSGEMAPAFVVRFEGRPRAFLNRCRHIPVELDWQPGRFFDDTGLYLVCATHGALYRAADGVCADGPCRGRGSLVALQVCEAAGQVWVAEPEEVR